MTIYIGRREVIRLLGGAAAAWPLAAGAQQPVRIRHIGALMNLGAADPESFVRVTAFAQGLQELGWMEGRNVRVHYTLGAGDNMPTVVAALVARTPPDVLLVNGTSVLRAAQEAAPNIPTVFVNVIDPVGQGFVGSLEHPGGNVTGFSTVDFEMGGKWLALLKEIAPQVTRVAVIGDEKLGGGAGIMKAIETAAPSFQVEVSPFSPRVADVGEPRAFNAFVEKSNAGLLVLPGSVTQARRERIIALAARYRLPAVYPYRYYVADGGLMCYGVDTADVYRQAAAYVDRILKGEKPADLPVQQPKKFALVVNVKTAKALGLPELPTLLGRANELIEDEVTQ